SLLARPGSSRLERLRPRRGAGAPCARASRRACGFHGRDRQRADRARPVVARAGPPRRGGDGVRPGGGELDAALVRQSCGGRVDGKGRSRHAPQRLRGGGGAVSPRRRSSSRRAVLGREVIRMLRKLLSLGALVVVAVAFGAGPAAANNGKPGAPALANAHGKPFSSDGFSDGRLAE